MSSVLDISSMYGTYGQKVSSVSADSLQSTLGSVGSASSDDELMSACKSFESYFVQKILEQAKSSIVGKDDEDEGEYMQYFGDMMTQQYADIISDSGSIGLAQQLYDAMKANYNL